MKKLSVVGLVATMTGSSFAVVAYDSTNFTSVSAASNGGATSSTGGTIVVADQLTINPAFIGWKLGRLDFGISNSDATATTARMRVRFWADNAGAPGTLLGGATFSAVALPAGANSYYADFAANNVTLTAKIWIGFLFDSTAATSPALVSKLNKLGLLYGSDTPAVGSSGDSVWASSATGSNFVSSPAGSVLNSPFGGNPVANAYFKVDAVPEPASMVALGLGLAAVARRRRSK